MTKIWGPVIWDLIHGLTIKIDESFFLKNIHNVLNLFNNILTTLPCPECSSHSLSVYKSNVSKINNKKKLVSFFHYLHNEVNKKLKKKIMDTSVLERYKKLDMKTVVIKWINVENDIKNVPKLMAVSMNNKFIKKKIILYIKNNINNFF
tara:strand:- start:15 stop:461 length:447 start_codon:yes stop_codon:yes gene_type:complete